MARISRLTQDALSLPLDDRIELAEQLWASLGPSADVSVEDQERETLDLADRRAADLETGSVEGASHAASISVRRVLPRNQQRDPYPGQ